MPISSNPNSTVPFSLDSDAEIPQKDRPAFLVRFMSQADLDRHAAIMKEAVAETDDLQCAIKLMEAVRVGVAGWKNFKNPAGETLPFTDQNFFDVLTDRERWVVAWQYPQAVQLTKVDLRFLDLRPHSATGPAANTEQTLAAPSTPKTP